MFSLRLCNIQSLNLFSTSWYETISQYCFNAGQLLLTLAQHQITIGSAYRFCCVPGGGARRGHYNKVHRMLIAHMIERTRCIQNKNITKHCKQDTNSAGIDFRRQSPRSVDFDV